MTDNTTEQTADDIGKVRDVYTVDEDQVLALSELDTGSVQTERGELHRALRLVGLDREDGREVRTTWLLTPRQAENLIRMAIETYADSSMMQRVVERLYGGEGRIR